MNLRKNLPMKYTHAQFQVGMTEQSNVISSGTGRDAYLLARDNPHVDIAALQAHVLKVGSGMDACFFARDVPGADIGVCEARVLQVGNVWDLHIFARHVPGANVSALHDRACKLSFESFPDEYQDEFMARAAKARAFSEDEEPEGPASASDAHGNG